MTTGFDTTPRPEFLRAMQNQRWTVLGALSELVDNAFGPGRGNASRVEIIHNTAKRTITVIDNGQGMEAIGRLFQLGNTIGRTPGDVGLYGSGGTMALLWLASRVKVASLKDGLVSSDTVDWSRQIRIGEFPQVSDEWKPTRLNNTPPELLDLGHGTLIHLELARERSFYPSNVQRDLAQTYAPGLRLGKQLIWTTIGKGGTTRPLADPFPDLEQAIDIDLILEVRGQDLGVRGQVGLVRDLPATKSKIAIGFGPRVILRTNDCYTSMDKEERYSGVGITGWIDFSDGWQPYLATTKDAMNDQPVWESLMGYLFQKIRPLLQQVDAEKVNVEFDDLALQLEQALGGLAKVEVNRSGVRHLEESGEEVVGRREGTETPDEERSPSTPVHLDPTEHEGEEAKAEEPAVTRIQIEQYSDEQLAGQLCQVEAEPMFIWVRVNRDHEVVQEALRSKPVNRMALNLLITREMAHEITQVPVLVRRLFPRRVAREIESLDETNQVRYIHRVLMDRARWEAA